MRFLALLGCLLPLALAGCGDSDHKPASTETGDTTGGDGAAGTSGGSAETSMDNGNALADDVLLTLDDKHEILAGGARLEVKEGRQNVDLTVTTVYPNNHDDLILLQVALDGVENAMGQHTENLTSTTDAVAVARAYIAQASYISQSGTIDVTLTNDGKLEGRFAAQLTPDIEVASDPATLAAKPLDVSGYFSGKWSLVCSSPVQILPGDHSTPDSVYCKNLTF